MSENVYGPIVTLIVGLIFVWLLVKGLKRGEMELPYFGITLSGRRNDQPIAYWAVTAVIATIAAFALLATIFQIFLPHGL